MEATDNHEESRKRTFEDHTDIDGLNKRLYVAYEGDEETTQSTTSAAHSQHDGAVGESTQASEAAVRSKVILLRKLPPQTTIETIQELLAPFNENNLPKIFLGHSGNQAFAEFQNEDLAAQCVQYAQASPFKIRDTPLLIMASHRDHVTDADETPLPRICLVTINQLKYPVTLEVLHSVLSKFGVVDKMVCFSRKPTLYQALVQFRDSNDTKRAMLNLNGRHMYTSCNTIQISPSRLTEVTVRENDRERAWDFTLKPYISEGADAPAAGLLSYGASQGAVLPVVGQGALAPLSQQGACLMSPQGGAQSQMMHMGVNPMTGMMDNTSQLMASPQSAHMAGMGAQSNLMQGMGGMMMSPQSPQSMSPTSATGANASAMGGMVPMAGQMGQMSQMNALGQLSSPGGSPTPATGCVLFVYNVPHESVDVNGLFNLFSIYGPVHRIKIMKDHMDTGLVQFGSPVFAQSARSMLSDATVFNRKMQVTMSKNAEIRIPLRTQSDGETGCPKTKEFTQRDQRYRPDENEKYIKLAYAPTSNLFIANIPNEISDQELHLLISRSATIKSLELRNSKNTESSKKIAIVALETPEQASNCVCLYHNHTLNNCSIKVAFSKMSAFNASMNQQS